MSPFSCISSSLYDAVLFKLLILATPKLSPTQRIRVGRCLTEVNEGAGYTSAGGHVLLQLVLSQSTAQLPSNRTLYLCVCVCVWVWMCVGVWVDVGGCRWWESGILQPHKMCVCVCATCVISFLSGV